MTAGQRMSRPRVHGWTKTRRAKGESPNEVSARLESVGEGPLWVPPESTGVVAIPLAPRVGRTSHEL